MHDEKPLITNLVQIDWFCLDNKETPAYPDLMQVEIINIAITINAQAISLSSHHQHPYQISLLHSDHYHYSLNGQLLHHYPTGRDGFHQLRLPMCRSLDVEQGEGGKRE